MKKILIANRGEIALRVMRSAKEMGIKTIAVYSDADRNSPHVQYADEAVHIGPAPSNESYLIGENIINAAKKVNADAIHPGYGFLSENATFAGQVKDAGLTFIGPDPEAIKLMGSKLAAKKAVSEYDIPLVPGTDEAITDIEAAKKIAENIGFPILIKASAGGGGKGMRIVNEAKDFEEQMKTAQREALSSFGDGSVFIEKYIGSPRHIEIQVLGDTKGNIIHLFERECSVQRRHQKVIEEAPSAVVTPEVRDKMGKSAVDVARACNYVGAGTVEFIAETLKDGSINYYFLEMNTRLQVEHPVTELITGIDLVKEQIRIARGEAISFKQEELEINGHAVELRVYAEDPLNNFLPDIGTLTTYRRPQGVGVRVDDGYEEGMEIPIYYDPMISKLITFGKDREEALQRMIRSIDEYVVSGVKNTLEFGKYVMQHPAFISGKFDTHFIENHFDPGSLQVHHEEEAAVAAMLASQVLRKSRGEVQTAGTSGLRIKPSAWKRNRLKN